MNLKEAEDIVGEIGGLIEGRSGNTKVLNTLDLPCSPGKAKYAFFMYVHYLHLNNLLENEHFNNLVIVFSVLNTAFKNNSEEINEALAIWKDNEKAREFIEANGGLMDQGVPNTAAMSEMRLYLEDLKGNWPPADR